MAHNYDDVRDVVAERVAKTHGRITAKRLLPVAVAAGYDGSDRNFRRLVAEEKRKWRQSNHRGRRPGVWSPGDMLVIDWGEIGPLSVFCAVLAWSRWRFVYFADNQRADTTFTALAACFEALGGVPATVLSDRMGCLKGGDGRRGWWSPPRTTCGSRPTTGSGPTSARATTPSPRASSRTSSAT